MSVMPVMPVSYDNQSTGSEYTEIPVYDDTDNSVVMSSSSNAVRPGSLSAFVLPAVPADFESEYEKCLSRQTGPISLTSTTAEYTAIRHLPDTNCSTEATAAESVLSSPHITSFAAGDCVGGVACIRRRVYVTRRFSRHIQVFRCGGRSAYRRTSTFQVDDLRDPNDMAADEFSRCLFVLDHSATLDRVFHLQLPRHRISRHNGSSVVAGSWSIGCRGTTLSVRSARDSAASCTVLVVCGDINSVREFTADGSLLRSIQLDSFTTECPSHAVYLSSNTLAVSSLGSPTDIQHRLCIVDAVDHAQPHSVYGERPGGPGSRRFNFPRHIAVCADGRLVLADRDNQRLVLFDSTLNVIETRSLAGTLKGLACHPVRLGLSETTLIVACNTKNASTDYLFNGGVVVAISLQSTHNQHNICCLS